MPVLTRWYIKTSLGFLVAALLVGLLLAGQSLSPVFRNLAVISPLYFHLFLLGWVAQLIFGIVYWMFPKYSMEKPRGNESLGWATYLLLNFGLILRMIGEPANSLHPSLEWGIVLAFSAVLQWLAGLAFVVNTWGRVKEK